MTQVGALQTAPILIAVVTSFLAMEGVKYLMASRMKAQPKGRTSPGVTPFRSGAFSPRRPARGRCASPRSRLGCGRGLPAA